MHREPVKIFQVFWGPPRFFNLIRETFVPGTNIRFISTKCLSLGRTSVSPRPNLCFWDEHPFYLDQTFVPGTNIRCASTKCLSLGRTSVSFRPNVCPWLEHPTHLDRTFVPGVKIRFIGTERKFAARTRRRTLGRRQNHSGKVPTAPTNLAARRAWPDKFSPWG